MLNPLWPSMHSYLCITQTAIVNIKSLLHCSALSTSTPSWYIMLTFGCFERFLVLCPWHIFTIFVIENHLTLKKFWKRVNHRITFCSCLYQGFKVDIIYVFRFIVSSLSLLLVRYWRVIEHGYTVKGEQGMQVDIIQWVELSFSNI